MDLQLDIYARVSRLGDDRQRSEAGQVEDCEARAVERGARPGEVHVDSGRSAWNPRVRRPAWERLMSRLETGATGGVVVFDMARFSRRPIEGERLIVAAEQGLVVLDSEGEYDLTTANGRKTFRDQLNAAAYESDRLSTRTKRGKRVKASRGESNHSRRPFGFEPDGHTRRPAEDAVVLEVAERVLAGENQDRITVDLNDRGILTSTGGVWTRESLKQMLIRPRNNGQVVYDGVTVSRLPGEPILNDEMWGHLTAMFAARRRGRPVSDAYLGSGILTCGRCGHTLSGRPQVSRSPYPDGEVRRQYWCQPRAVGGGCGRLTIDQRAADRYIGGFVVRTLSDPRHASALETAAHALEDRRRPLLAELADAEQLADELAGRLGRQEITLRRYDAASAPLDRRIVVLRAELAGLESAPLDANGIKAASREEWSARWNAATVSERRSLLRQALSGRQLVVGPAERAMSGRPAFDPSRITLTDGSPASRLP